MKWLRSAGKRLAGAALLLAAIGASPALAEGTPQTPRPAIWLLADEDTKIYLFGTLHVLPPDLIWRSAELNRIIEEADELVMELDEEDAQESMLTAFEQVMLGKNVPLIQRVSPGRRPALRRMLSETGLPAETFDGLQTWAAAMALSMGDLWGAAGGKGETQPPSGVEEVLNAEFVRRERPVSGVETPEQQLGFFSNLPQRVQRELLEQTIDAWASGLESLDADETDWLSGDVEAIGRGMEILPPEVFTVVLTNRNRAWTEWLIDRLEQPGTILFAVGAGHLAGRDSVQSMLAERGVSAARID